MITVIMIITITIILSKYFPILIGQKHTHNSPQLAADDKIWKNFAINEPMTSKVQLSAG